MQLSSFRKLQRLSAAERWLLAQALVLLPLTLLGVYAVGVKRWQRALDRLFAGIRSTKHSVAIGNDEAASERARLIARMVRIAAEYGIFRANCLQQSLVLWWLLRRESVESEIRFGARKEESRVQAHAWVECFGIALSEDGDICRHFLPFEGSAVTAQTEI